MISDDNEEEKGRIFTDYDISQIVDYAMKTMDRDSDGFIEFPEFVHGQEYATGQSETG